MGEAGLNFKKMNQTDVGRRVQTSPCSFPMDAIGRRNGSKKRILCSSATRKGDEPNAKRKQFEQLAHLNAMVEQAWLTKQANAADTELRISPGFLHESAWDTWLWGEDPLEEAPISTTLNRMQLLGFLIARYVFVF